MITITLSDPDRRNVQDPAFWRALAELGATLPADVRGVLLQSDGPSFSAGLDRAMLTPGGIEGEPTFAELAALDSSTLDAQIDAYQGGFTWWSRPDLVTVAAVQGHAVGAGFQLALACDVRVVADDVAFAMRETVLGLVPDLAGTWPLVQAVGYSAALEICLTGRWVHAAEAVSRGIALYSVPGGELRTRARATLEAMLAAPAGAVMETKALLIGASARVYDEQRALERAAQGRRLKDLARALGGRDNP